MEYVKEIKYNELHLIEGGLNVTASLINSITAGVKIILEVGRSLGSVLRRGTTGDICKM